MEDLIWLEHLATWLPALASFFFLVRLWRGGELYGTRSIVFTGWFLVAFVAQFAAPSAVVWIAALMAQLLLAIVVLLKDRLANL